MWLYGRTHIATGCHAGVCSSCIDHASLSKEMSHAANVTEVEHVMLSSEHKHVEDDSCWYLDTGCSNYMTRRREWIVNLDPRIKSNVRFADDSTVTVEGVGRVLIMCKNGGVTYMDDMLYVPTMKSNLLSLDSSWRKPMPCQCIRML